MKTSRISLNQMFSLMVLFLVSSAALLDVGRYSGQDVWIGIFCSGALALLLFTLYHRISQLHGYRGLAEIIKDIFGKWIGGILIYCYAFYFLLLTAGLLKDTTDMIRETLMIDSSVIVLMCALMLPAVYGLILGINTVGRSSELLLYVVGICFIPLLIAVFTSDIFQSDNLFPILEHSISSLAGDIFRMTLFPYGEVITFLLIFPLIPSEGKGKILKYSYGAIIVATLLLVGIDVVNIGILGPTLTKNFVYPFFNSVKMIGISVLFERLDPLAIVILMTTCFFKITIYFYAGLACLEKVWVRFNYRQLAIPISIILIIAGLHISNNQIENLYRVITVLPHYLLPYFELIIPFVIWGVSEIKYHTHQKQIENET